MVSDLQLRARELRNSEELPPEARYSPFHLWGRLGAMLGDEESVYADANLSNSSEQPTTVVVLTPTRVIRAHGHANTHIDPCTETSTVHVETWARRRLTAVSMPMGQRGEFANLDGDWQDASVRSLCVTLHYDGHDDITLPLTPGGRGALADVLPSLLADLAAGPA